MRYEDLFPATIETCGDPGDMLLEVFAVGTPLSEGPVTFAAPFDSTMRCELFDSLEYDFGKLAESLEYRPDPKHDVTVDMARVPEIADEVYTVAVVTRKAGMSKIVRAQFLGTVVIS